jgi:hypothetical protein
MAALFPIVFMCLPLFGASASSSYLYTEGRDTTTADGRGDIGFTVCADSINGAARPTSHTIKSSGRRGRR